MVPFHHEKLANGLILEFFDRSNRYFGDYWNLCVDACCRIPLAAADLEAPLVELARGKLGEEALYTRRLQRMGVSTEQLAASRREMVEQFLANTRSYLESPLFPARFVVSQLQPKRIPGNSGAR